MRSAQKDQTGRLRTVVGTVGGGANVVNGTGFVVSTTGAGAYTVRFAEPFAGPPITTVSLAQGGTYSVQVTSSDATSFSVQVFNTTTGAAINGAFSFTAQGISR